ncbi:MAG: hypothetical protein ACMUHX_09085 [bacterium]
MGIIKNKSFLNISYLLFLICFTTLILSSFTYAQVGLTPGSVNGLSSPSVGSTGFGSGTFSGYNFGATSFGMPSYGGGFSMPSYGGSFRMPSYIGGFSMPSYGGSFNMPSYTGGFSMPSYGGSFSMPSYTGGFSMPSYGGSFSMPSYTGGFSMPNYGGSFSMPSYTGGFSMPSYSASAFGNTNFGLNSYGTSAYGVTGFSMPNYSSGYNMPSYGTGFGAALFGGVSFGIPSYGTAMGFGTAIGGLPIRGAMSYGLPIGGFGFPAFYGGYSPYGYLPYSGGSNSTNTYTEPEYESGYYPEDELPSIKGNWSGKWEAFKTDIDGVVTDPNGQIVIAEEGELAINIKSQKSDGGKISGTIEIVGWDIDAYPNWEGEGEKMDLTGWLDESNGWFNVHYFYFTGTELKSDYSNLISDFLWNFHNLEINASESGIFGQFRVRGKIKTSTGYEDYDLIGKFQLGKYVPQK